MLDNNSKENYLETDKCSENQEARALLRERFLRLISHLSGGQNCRIKLFENLNHICQVRAFNPSFENVIVENLITNYPQPVERAIIRTSDVITMHFEVDKLWD